MRKPLRFLRFATAFFSLLATAPNRAPTPTNLNAAMGRRSKNDLDGELTRWRTFLLREFGFRKKRRVQGRWVRTTKLDKVSRKRGVEILL